MIKDTAVREEASHGNHEHKGAVGGGLIGRWVRMTGSRRREVLGAIRPDLNGIQIMEILGIPEGPDVGRAYKFLLERRIEEGPLGEDAPARTCWPGGLIRSPE